MRTVKLIDVCDFQGGTQPPAETFIDEPREGYVRLLQIRDFASDKQAVYIPKNGNWKYCTEDDVCIARYGASIGRILRGRKGAYNVAIVRTIPDSESLNKDYLYYILNGTSFQSFIKNIGSRAAQAGFNKNDLARFEIPLPDLGTQRVIAARLDQADALRQKDRQLLALYDQLTQSVFLDLFGDPIRNEKGWGVKRLKDCCKQITDGTHFSPPNVENGVPYVTAKHLRKHGLDFFSDPTYVAEEEHKKIYSRCSPKKGDVLYIKDGATTGLAAVNQYDFEFSMLSSLALIKPETSLLTSYFLVYWLNNNAVKEKLLSANMAGAAIKRFTLQKIKNFEILLPPLPLQQRFAEIVAQIERQKALVQQQIEQSEALFQRLLQDSFSN